MHGDPAPPGGFQRLTAALPTPFIACFLGCAKAWRVCGQRANCRPGSFRAWGSEGLGNPDLVHIPMHPLSDPSAGSTGLRHSSLQAPDSPGRQWACVSGAPASSVQGWAWVLGEAPSLALRDSDASSPQVAASIERGARRG